MRVRVRVWVGAWLRVSFGVRVTVRGIVRVRLKVILA